MLRARVTFTLAVVCGFAVVLAADRFPLKARDVVFVDTAGVTRWGRVINQVLPSISILNKAGALAVARRQML